MAFSKLKKRLGRFIARLRSSPSLFVLFVEIVLGVGISVLVFYAFWELTEEVLEQEVYIVDHAVSDVIYSMRTPLLTDIMHFISFIGMDGILLLSMAIPVFLLWKNKIGRAVFFTVMIGMGVVVNMLLKIIILRPRPTIDPLAIENTYSFPSGHSMSSFIFFLTIAYFYYHFTKKKKRSLIIFGVAALIILSIGLSRVYLGVHYPSDVIGGYLAGFLWFVSILVIDKTINFWKLFRVK